MSDILRISGALLLIVILTMKKWNLGGILILSTLFIAAVYRLTPLEILRSVYLTAVDWTTINLILSLTFIRGFEYILRKRGLLQDMMNTLRGLFRGNRAGVAAMPALIGMLPSVGGALFSAPMVEESTRGMALSAERKSFINYWFRHPWEYVLPLYPGIVLASGLTGIPLRTYMTANALPALSMVVIGDALGLKGLRVTGGGGPDGGAAGVRSFIPIVTLLAFVMVFHLGLLQALLLELLFVFLFLRSPLSEVVETLRNSISLEIIVLIFGTVLFKTTMETSGGIRNLSAFFTANKVPLMPLLFFLPCITGVLTGFTVGFVGATFPLLLSLVKQDVVRNMAFAFCSGYIGVLLSPVHLCLILTKQYFGADMGKIYRRVIPAVLLTFAVGIVEYWFF